MRNAGIWQRVVLALCVLLLLCACQNQGEGETFRYDIAEPVKSLDPQFATGTDARIILANLYEGLVVQGQDGEILPGVAKSYTVSEDGLRYTFALREDAVWNNGDPVTAEDFVYAFVRLFRDGSPYAENYMSILGAGEMLAGKAQTLPGVTASSAHELVITLAQPDVQLLTHLTEPAASPCNEKAFTEARGRYGLEKALVCSNGPFALSRWDDVRVSLQKSESYCSELPTIAQAVHFYIGRDAPQQYLDGKTDAALLDWTMAGELDGGQQIPVAKTVWAIVFNQDHELWGNAMLRQGMALAIDRAALSGQVVTGFQPASLLVPESMCVLGSPYRPLAFSQSPMEFNSREAVRLFEKGLEVLDLRQLPTGAAITVPEFAKTSLGMNELQQGWQKYLSAFVSIRAATEEEIQTQLDTGEYGMLLMGFPAEGDQVQAMLEPFTSTADGNRFAYRDALFDTLLQNAEAQTVPAKAAEKYAQAEMRLLADAVVIPLYLETATLAIADGVENLQVSTAGDRMYFKYAQKD